MGLFATLGLLMLLAFGGLAGIRAAEKRTIWVGMAKETAHQLGTPLSSLMGWVELLRANVESAPPDGDVAIPRTELAETLDDMEGDIDRLNKVAQRFSHIGSAPQLWHSDRAQQIRDEASRCRKCWMMCTARSKLKKQPVAIATWLVLEQARTLADGARRRNRDRSPHDNIPV